jgi:hypothetical protein
MGNKPDRQKRIQLKANRETVTERAGLLPEQLGDLRTGLGLQKLPTKRIGATPLKARGKDRNANPGNPAAGQIGTTAVARANRLDRQRGKPGSKKAAATRAARLEARTAAAAATRAAAAKDRKNAAARARRAAKRAGAAGAPKRGTKR